jgi:hypothetical protein
LFFTSPVAAARRRRGQARRGGSRAGERSRRRVDDAEAARLAARVKAEFLHAWGGYRQYAWGHDGLKPLSKAPQDWYAQSLLMTPVDALDTMLVMGLDDEAKQARELVATQLSFDKDMDVKHFEIVIRLLGGLLSSYQLTGDERLLKLAQDLGDRMLPAFDTPTGIPYVNINLQTGKGSGTDSNPAEAGTLLLEYGMLSKLTGKPEYYDKAKRALVATYERRSKIGLVGERFDSLTGKWTSTSSHAGARIDSYYEYLFKCAQLFGDKDCQAMWSTSIAAANRYYLDEVDGALWSGQVDMDTGKRTGSDYGALDAFYPGLLAYSGDVERARRLQVSTFAMWNLHGIEPEAYDYRQRKITSGGYPLRPEDRRIDLVPLSRHRRPPVPGDGPQAVRGLRRPLPHRGRLRRHRGRDDDEAGRRHGELRARRNLQVLLPAVRAALERSTWTRRCSTPRRIRCACRRPPRREGSARARRSGTRRPARRPGWRPRSFRRRKTPWPWPATRRSPSHAACSRYP